MAAKCTIFNFNVVYVTIENETSKHSNLKQYFEYSHNYANTLYGQIQYMLVYIYCFALNIFVGHVG